MSLVIGGIVAPENVVGRVRESREILATLPSGGAVLVGDRRHGKTSLSRLVQREAAGGGAMVVSVSAERESYEEFVAALAASLESTDPDWAQELERWRLTFMAGPIKAERATRAPAALDELLNRAVQRARGRLLVLFIDEVTVLARNLERGQPGSGDRFLHLLRRIRQENPGRVATVLSGSIGFHHVSADAASTVNDISKISVGPIRSDHAAYLAACLLLGSGTPTTDPPALAAAIAEAAENVPYYIQHLVSVAKQLSASARRACQPGDVPGLVTAAIDDPYDRWDLRHYRDRLVHYYGSDAPGIGRLLDVYAHSAVPLDVDTVLQRLHNEGSGISDRAQLVSLVERLQLDHYLTRVDDRDRFASPLVQRAWKAMRR